MGRGGEVAEIKRDEWDVGDYLSSALLLPIFKYLIPFSPFSILSRERNEAVEGMQYVVLLFVGLGKGGSRGCKRKD